MIVSRATKNPRRSAQSATDLTPGRAVCPTNIEVQILDADDCAEGQNPMNSRPKMIRYAAARRPGHANFNQSLRGVEAASNGSA